MLADLVRKAAKGARAEPPSAATLAFLKKHRVPPAIIENLKGCSVAGHVPVGRLILYAFSTLPQQNAKPHHPALENGFLVIGCGPTGDPIAVELSNGEVAFLSHDLLWGLDPEETAFEECVARSTLDLDAFWKRALVAKDFPSDFYDAGGA